jgi:hypothetical protein
MRIYILHGKDDMDKECSTNKEKMNVYRFLVGKQERKRPKHRWVDNIKVDHIEIR